MLDVDVIAPIYHGSDKIIKTPEFGKGKAYNDYGLGFYMTRDKELAGEWATLATGVDGYVNEYVLRTWGLTALFLDREDIKRWIAILMHNREGNYKDELRDIQAAFCAEYLLDVQEYDLIIGYRADDSYFSYVEDFVLGLLSLENLQRAMRFGDLGLQICLKSEKAFDSIEYVTQYPAPANRFYQLAKDRDNAARAAYRQMRSEINAREGTLITSLI